MVRQRIILPLVVLAIVGASYYNQHQGIAAQAREGRVAHDALCAFKAGLQQDIKNSVEYLDNHPQGAPAIGLSVVDIQRSIDDRKRRIRQLNSAGLEC